MNTVLKEAGRIDYSYVTSSPVKIKLILQHENWEINLMQNLS